MGGSLPEAEALEAVRLSFAEWERQSCTDVQFVERAPAGRGIGYATSGRNANVVLFRDADCEDVAPRDAPCRWEGGCGNEYDCWDFGKDGDRLIAVTTTTFSQCTGRIVDADIEFNARHFDFTTGSGGPCGQGAGSDCVKTDLRNTLVHEIGHLLGFDHSPVNGSTMYVTAQPGEVEKRSLHEVDIAGLCDVYPAGEPTWICEPARLPAQCGERTESQVLQVGLYERWPAVGAAGSRARRAVGVEAAAGLRVRALTWLFMATVALGLLAPAQAAAFERSLVRGTQICLFWESRDLPWSLSDWGTDGLALESDPGGAPFVFRHLGSGRLQRHALREDELSDTTAVGYSGKEGTSNS